MLLDIIKKGSVDRAVYLKIIDSTDGTPETGVVYNTSGIDLWYRREGAAKVSITEATLAALTTAHADGGFLHVGDGIYRLDLPDAAWATGANQVYIGGTVTGMIVIGGVVKLVDYDPEDTVRMGLTALPNAAAAANGGLPTVDATNSVKIRGPLKKGQALTAFPFILFDSTTGAPKPGVTVGGITVTRQIDGGSASAGTLGSVTEQGDGVYLVDWGTGDTNGNAIVFRASATGTLKTVERLFPES